jgi:hypothetical protein
MTKITCVYAPAAATMALLFARRPAAAIKLGTLTAAGALLALGMVHVVSEGRALESFRACALAGSSLLSLLSPVAVTRALQLIGTSHLLTVVFVLVALALLAAPRTLVTLPVLYLLSASAITAVIFTSPGTILTSQIVDAYVAAVVVLTISIGSQVGAGRVAGFAVLTALTLWTAGQNVARTATMIEQGAIRSGRQERQQLIAAVNECSGSLISESPLVPILADQRPVLLDPFAFHVVSLNRPEVGRDLVERIRRREFACLILEQDPATPRGHAWYSNVNLTEAVRDAILESYRYDRTVAGQRFYRALQ